MPLPGAQVVAPVLRCCTDEQVHRWECPGFAARANTHLQEMQAFPSTFMYNSLPNQEFLLCWLQVEFE